MEMGSLRQCLLDHGIGRNLKLASAKAQIRNQLSAGPKYQLEFP